MHFIKRYTIFAVKMFLWLDPINGSIDYTYHNEQNGHYKLLDHIIASPCLVASNKAVSILVEDDNISDHYGISFVCNIDRVPVTKVVCQSMPSSYLIEERQLMFLVSYNVLIILYCEQ